MRLVRQAERDAIAIYTNALRFTTDPEMRTTLESLRRDEEGHQRLLERALARL